MADEIKNEKVDLTVEHVSTIFKLGSTDAQKWYAIIKPNCEAAGINNVLRYSAFFAQIGHESSNLKVLEENLNYSASGLLATFPKYFNAESAAQYARKPEAIGSRVYGNRMGNGNEDSKEGYKFRGRGCIQITGKENYTQLDKTVPCLTNPDVLLQPDGAIRSAIWFWSRKGLNNFADRGDLAGTTRIINGGQNGAADRQAKYQFAIEVLTGKKGAVIQPDKTTSDTVEPSPSASSGQGFQEPGLGRQNSKYPYNAVMESRSGHVIEVDDSPGGERLFYGHRSGSYWNMLPDGSVCYKTVLDRFDITLGNHYLYAQEDYVVKVKGQEFHRVEGDVVYSVGGTFFIEVGRVQLNAGLVVCRDTLIAKQGEFQDLSCENVAQLKAADAEHADTASSLGGKAGSLVNGLSESLEMTPEGTPNFKTPVEFDQPVKMKNTTSGGGDGGSTIPDPSAFPSSLQVVNGRLCFSDGTSWRPIAFLDEIGTGGGSSGG